LVDVRQRDIITGKKSSKYVHDGEPTRTEARYFLFRFYVHPEDQVGYYE